MNTCINQAESKKEYYIYNIKQALFFISKGCPITEDDIRVNQNSCNVYFRFHTGEQLKKAWTEWNKGRK